MANSIKLKGHEFPSLDDYLEERGLVDRVSIAAEKLAISRQLLKEMEAKSISKTDMAARMGTSRAQLDRLLNPRSQNVTVETLARAAQVVGRRFHMRLV